MESGKIIFSNKMGLRNLFYVAIVVIAAGALLLASHGGEGIALMLGAVFAIVLLSLGMVWLVVKVAAASNIAELSRTQDGLVAEMVHMFGKGAKLALPMPRPDDWSWELLRHGKGSRQKTAVIKLRSENRTFKLWMTGVRVLDKDAFREIAPGVIEEMQAAGYVK
jgi:hypothetical protein